MAAGWAIGRVVDIKKKVEGYSDTQHSDRDGSGMRDRTTVWIAESNRWYIGDNYSKDDWERKGRKKGRLPLTSCRGPVLIRCP